MFRTIPIGKADPKHYKMHEACVEALKNCENKLIPGNKIGEVFDAHAKTFDDLGFNKARMNACGYSLGNNFFSKLDGLANVIYKIHTLLNQVMFFLCI